MSNVPEAVFGWKNNKKAILICIFEINWQHSSVLYCFVTVHITNLKKKKKVF